MGGGDRSLKKCNGSILANCRDILRLDSGIPPIVTLGILERSFVLKSMNFDLSGLNQAISNLENAQSPQQSGGQALEHVIGQIIQAAMGDSLETQPLDADAQFNYLRELAIAGNTEVFAQLLAADNSSRAENQPTFLMGAVLAGQTEVVGALIAAGADVNIRIRNFFWLDAIGFAVDKEHLKIVKLLITAGANLQWHDPGNHPVTTAVSKNNVELLKILLDAGANTIFSTGFSIMGKAAEQAGIEIMEVLVDAGCDVDEVSSLGDTPLVNACLRGRDEVVRYLLNAGADPNLSGRNGVSPLAATFSIPTMIEFLTGWDDTVDCSNSSLRMITIIQLLLDAGADFDQHGSLGQTPLMVAAKNGLTDIALLLIRQGAQVNTIEDLRNWVAPQYITDCKDLFLDNLQFKTALIFAVEGGHTEIVAALLKAGADVTIADKSERLPIDIAIQEGYTEIIQLLQAAGAQEVDGAISSSPSALLGAAKRGNLEVLRSALAAGIDPNISESDDRRNSRYKTALMFATERGHLEVAEYLIFAGADVNLSDRPGKKLGKTPLMYAAESERSEIIQLLLRSGAMVDAQDKRGQTALYYAVLEQKTESVRLLLDAGADPHKKNWDGTPFEQATYSGQAIASLISNHDGSSNSFVSDRAKEEMLRSVAFSGNLGIVRDLLAQGVDINAQERGGWTALAYACARGHLSVAQVLLAAGADINIKSKSGCTALSESVYWGHLDIVNILLSAGAAVDGPDKENSSAPLIKTIYLNRTDILKILLEAGANPNIRDNNGKTALEIAIEHKKTQIAAILRQAGGI
jgi:ankyrin repeat protein